MSDFTRALRYTCKKAFSAMTREAWGDAFISDEKFSFVTMVMSGSPKYQKNCESTYKPRLFLAGLAPFRTWAIEEAKNSMAEENFELKNAGSGRNPLS